MKKVLFLITVFVLLTCSPILGAIGDNLSFETVKNTVLQRIDKKINALTTFKETKLANAKIDEEDKVLINSIIDEVITGLEQYKTKVEATTTMDELKQARKETNQYVVSNQQKIKDAVKELVTALSDEALAAFEQARANITVKVDELEQKCPDQAEKINELQSEVDKIDKELNQLVTLLQGGASQEILIAKVASIATMIKSIIPEIKEVATACKSSV